MAAKVFTVRLKQTTLGVPGGATVEVVSNNTPPMIHEIHAAFKAKYGKDLNGNGYAVFDIR